MELSTIFFNEYPKKEKDISKKSMLISFAASLCLLICGLLLILISDTWVSILLFLICLVASYDSIIQGITKINYIKNPKKDIYDKYGNRVD